MKKAFKNSVLLVTASDPEPKKKFLWRWRPGGYI